MNDTTFQGNGSVKYVPVVVDTKPKPITNADHIRSMTDEELAEFLQDIAMFGGVDTHGIKPITWIDWLQRPATE